MIDQKKIIKELFLSGATMQDIGDRLGRSKQWVSRVIKAQGISRTEGGARLRSEKRSIKKQIEMDSAANERCLRMYGCSQSQLKRIKHRTSGLKVDPFESYRSTARYHKGRGTKVEMTFYQWFIIWDRSGKLGQKGVGRGQYAMVLKDKLESFTPSNVEILSTARINNKNSLK